MKENLIFKSTLPYFTEESLSKLLFHLFKKKDGGYEVCPAVLIKLLQNWVICIEKGCPNIFAQVTTIFCNLYWKHYPLIKNVNEIPDFEVFLGSNLNFMVFPLGSANGDNI